MIHTRETQPEHDGRLKHEVGPLSGIRIDVHAHCTALGTCADITSSASGARDTILSMNTSQYAAGDTIAAIATPPGVGGVGIVRVSGPDAISIGQRLFRPASARDGALAPQKLGFGAVIDPPPDEPLPHA